MKLIVLLCCCLFSHLLVGANDVEILKQRIKDEIYVDINNINVSSAVNIMNEMELNGSYSDINYSDKSRTNWNPQQHLARIRQLCFLYLKKDQEWYNNSDLLAKIELGLNYWYSVNPVSDNWWYNDIGKQKELNVIGMMMSDSLNSTLLQKVINDLSDVPSMTGANLTDIATSVIYRGIIEDSIERINSGLNAIKNEIKISTGDGIKVDFSFHQHNKLLYNRGYGYEFLKGTTYWYKKALDTSFAFSADKENLLNGMLLDGNRWMVRGSFMDYGTDGRGITRPNASAYASVNYLRRLASDGNPRQEELLASADSISQGKRQDIIGNKHFWESDYMAHHREKYFTSVRMCSSRTKGTETINEENLKGYWLPFGVNFIFQRGDEYKDIFPVWDWGRLPGVTSPHIELKPGSYVSQSEDFVGGVSDSIYGIAAMRFNKEQTKARKAWFLFDDEWVALGAGISSTHTKEINTTINQTLLNSSELYVDGGQLSLGTHSYPESVNWVLHDGVGYFMLDKSPVKITASSRSGSWYSINKTKSDDTVEKDVFTLWINHGAKPSNKKYAYAVKPGITKADAVAYQNNVPVDIIINSTTIQAVHHKELKMTGVVFHAKGELLLDSGYKIKVDHPCILMLKEDSNGDTYITVSNPAEDEATITCTIIANGEEEDIQFDLPTGDKSGGSVTKLVEKDLITDVELDVKDNDIKVYPNPSNGIVNIESGSFSSKYLEVYNVAGSCVYKNVMNSEKEQVDLSNLTSGYYFLKLTGKDLNYTEKVLIK